MPDNDSLSKLQIPSSECFSINEEIVRILTWIFVTVLCQTIDVFGTAANIINIVCFIRQGFKDSVNVTLLALSVSDLGCVTTLILISISLTPSFTAADSLFEPLEVGNLVATMPHLAFSRVTNLIMAVVTLERCLCIMAPLKVKDIVTPKLTAILMVCIYGFSIFCAIPAYTVNRLGTKYSPQRNRTVLGILFMKDREIVEKISFAINNVSVPFAAFIVIVISTITLVVGLQRASEWRRISCQTQDSKIYIRNQKAAKMVVMVSTLFIVCFIPMNLIMMALTYEPELSYGGKCIHLTIIMGQISVLLESINSSANIIIYYHMSSKYRETLTEMMCW